MALWNNKVVSNCKFHWWGTPGWLRFPHLPQTGHPQPVVSQDSRWLVRLVPRLLQGCFATRAQTGTEVALPCPGAPLSRCPCHACTPSFSGTTPSTVWYHKAQGQVEDPVSAGSHYSSQKNHSVITCPVYTSCPWTLQSIIIIHVATVIRTLWDRH